MTILEFAKLKVGDSFKYHGESAKVNFIRPKYPDERVWITTDKIGKWVNIPDDSVAIGFMVGGKEIALVSRIGEKMVVDGVFKSLDLTRFGYSR